MKGCAVRRWFREFWRCTSGSSLVEVTIVMPLAISLMVGGAEFGRAMWAYHTADKSVKGAARYLARLPEAALSPSVQGWAIAGARNLAMKGTLDSSGAYLLRGWTDPEKVSLDQDRVNNSKIVHIEAEVPFSVPMLTIVGLPDVITFRVRHEERLITE